MTLRASLITQVRCWQQGSCHLSITKTDYSLVRLVGGGGVSSLC